MFLLSYTFSEYCSNQQSPWGVLRSSQCEHLGVQYHCSRVSQQCYGGVLLLPEHFPSYVHRSQSGKKKTSKFIFLEVWDRVSTTPTPTSSTHSDISQAVLAQRHQRVPVMQLLAAPLEVGRVSNCTWSNRGGATHWLEWAALEGCTSVSGHSLDAEAFLGPASCKRWCQLRLLSTVLTAEVWSDLAPRVAYVTNRGRQDS